MFGRLKALLGGDAAAVSADESQRDDEALHLASAALLVEAACMDGHVDDAEINTIGSLLASQFGLAADEVEELLDAGRKAVDESTQLYAFTRVIKDSFSHEERVRMIEMLWEVAYADGHVHHYESNLVRRVAGLIYVADRESGEARKRVEKRLESGGAQAI